MHSLTIYVSSTIMTLSYIWLIREATDRLQNVVIEWLILMLRIRDVSGSDLGSNTRYRE